MEIAMVVRDLDHNVLLEKSNKFSFLGSQLIFDDDDDNDATPYNVL